MATAESRTFKADVSNYGWRFKGQHGVAPGLHQSSGERKKRATWREESEENNEEQIKETEQFWDNIWTGKEVSGETVHLLHSSYAQRQLWFCQSPR